MTRLLVAEDEGMMRDALVQLLGLEPDLEVVAAVASGDDVVAAALEHRPDVALLDIEMPGLSGLDVVEPLRRALPGCAVVMLTTFGRPGYVNRALASGVRAFVVKDGPVDALAAVIRRVLAGEVVVDGALATEAVRLGTSPLSAREREVLLAAREGGTIAELGTRLHLSPSTVRNYLSEAIGKTGTRSRLEAVRVAEQRGWL